MKTTRAIRRLAWLAVLASPLAAGAQSPFNATSTPNNLKAAEIGGKTAVDIIRLDGVSPSFPLRHGGVVAGSEMVDHEGRTLVRGKDYALDNDQGVIYLLFKTRNGQTLRVQYRHDPSRAQTNGTLGSSFGGPTGFGFKFMPGASFALSLGMTERQQDGTIITNNVYGMNNSFSFGQKGGLKGMFVVGDRKKVDAQSAYNPESAGGKVDEGRSQAFFQNLDTGVLGGRVEAGYQDIGKKFSAFQSFKNAGFDNAYVDQLAKERGLKRTSLGFKDIGGKGLKLSNSYREVKDGKGMIQWRSLGLDTGVISFQWNGQKVSNDFNRFNDIAEADRGQLAKEKGLDRQTFASALKTKGLGANFQSLKVEDQGGNGVYRRQLSFDAVGKVKLNYYDQQIEKGFTRFASLREPEAGQWAREQGLRRENIGVEVAPPAKGVDATKFNTSTIRSDAGHSNSLDFSTGAKGWKVEHSSRATDKGFANLPSTSDSEILGNIKSIGHMYEAADFAIKPEEKGWYFNSAGLNRSGTRLTGPLGKAALSLDQVSIKGAEGSADVMAYRVGLPTIQFALRNEQVDSKFGELGKLMEFERQRLGTIAGFKRTDFDLSGSLKKGTQFSFNSLQADSENGGATRQALAYTAKGFSLNWVKRNVDKDFTNVNQVVDKDRDFFAQMVGFRQGEMKLNWQLLPSLGIQAFRSDANNPTTGVNRTNQTDCMTWKPDKLTEICIQDLLLRNDDPSQLLFDHKFEKVSMSRNMGRFGNLHLEQVTKDYSGVEANQPDSVQQSMSYETKLNDKTSVRTEQSTTKFENGEKEQVNTNTVSTEISKRTGISVTETHIDRDGDKPDERKRSYGFWWDFGKGIRLNYGYGRNLNSNANGNLQSLITLTPGNIGGLKVDNASYNFNRWDTTRNQALGNVQLGTVKPLQLGLLRDLTFFFSANTNHDMGAWIQENRSFGVGTRIGNNKLTYQYLGQIQQNIQQRGVDRLFAFETDQDPKRAFRASVKYKLRTLPGDKQVMIRDYSFSYRPGNGIELTHQLLTNPEQPRGDVILGSMTQPVRTNRWKLDFNKSVDAKLGASWDEIINEQTHTRSRMGGVNFTLFANKPSPLFLYYGIEQIDQGSHRQTAHRYSLRFDQRPGPNQLFSMFAGNVNWQDSRPSNQKIQNWSIRFEYQLRF